MDNKTAQLIESLRRDPARAQALLQTGDGRRLMQLLTQGDNGVALEHAAQSAVRGSTAELSAMLTSLMKSDEGRALMQRIGESAKK